MRNEVKDVKKMLRDSTFYMLISNEEKVAIYTAIAYNFKDTRH
jgi:hypothetical protein